MTPKIAVVDFGFLLLAKNLSLINECTVLDYNSFSSETTHVKCDAQTLCFVKQKFRYQLLYNKKNFHKLPFEYGFIEYKEFCKTLRTDLSSYDIVLVKGGHKTSFLCEIINDNDRAKKCVYNLDTFDCPTLNVLHCNHINSRLTTWTNCGFHTEPNFQYCTAYKTRLIEKWVQRNLSFTSK
jgi:hypothetical protein